VNDLGARDRRRKAPRTVTQMVSSGATKNFRVDGVREQYHARPFCPTDYYRDLLSPDARERLEALEK